MSRAHGDEPRPWLQPVIAAASVAAPILNTIFAVIVGVHYLPWWR